MRAIAAAWADEAIVQAPLAQLTWYHNLALLEKVERAEQRLGYARQAIEHGWSRNVLVAQMETGLHKRAGKALTNFKTTLQPPHSDLAQQTLKDPYVFDASRPSRNSRRSLGGRGVLGNPMKRRHPSVKARGAGSATIRGLGSRDRCGLRRRQQGEPSHLLEIRQEKQRH